MRYIHARLCPVHGSCEHSADEKNSRRWRHCITRDFTTARLQLLSLEDLWSANTHKEYQRWCIWCACLVISARPRILGPRAACDGEHLRDVWLPREINTHQEHFPPLIFARRRVCTSPRIGCELHTHSDFDR
ncbi:hypothetical protein PsYK624_158100 [Phanerochaete sordida]|uniref:Uncharacterized protein n=1 Tax=Phanerochaete sordida TaxID=48140 RepID=A0A9P3GPL4_9APHY|nr:hypothetical protein PsYK624_158100 [Phanerochaete sordida]